MGTMHDKQSCSDSHLTTRVLASIYDHKPYEYENSIRGFFGKYRFLSNFYPSRIVIGDIEYPTVENAFQAMKTKDKGLRERISKMSPGNAKKFGREIPLRTDVDWDGHHSRVVMFHVLLLKFEIAELASDLILTGNKHLEEANTWGDRRWGVHYTKIWRHGQNGLGMLLEVVRNFR